MSTTVGEHTHIFPLRVMTKFDVRFGIRPQFQMQACRECGAPAPSDAPIPASGSIAAPSEAPHG